MMGNEFLVVVKSSSREGSVACAKDVLCNGSIITNVYRTVLLLVEQTQLTGSQ